MVADAIFCAAVCIVLGCGVQTTVIKIPNAQIFVKSVENDANQFGFAFVRADRQRPAVIKPIMEGMGEPSSKNHVS